MSKKAKKLLMTLLAREPKTLGQIMKVASPQGLTRHQMERAARQLKVSIITIDNKQTWRWSTD